MLLGGYEKAAIFLSSIGEDAASEVLKFLDEKDIGKISMHMTKMKMFKRSSVNEVLKEAIEIISKGDIHIEGEEFFRKVLSKRLGEEKATKIMEMATAESPLDAIKWIDSKTLTNFLVGEQPQTIALIICLLDPVQGARVLSSLPQNLMADVAMRIATTEKISQSAIEEINEVLRDQLDIGRGKDSQIGGVKTIAEILNQCNKTHEEMIFEKINAQNNPLAESIRQHMFVFDDLAKVDDRGIQAILKEISTEDLTLALKTTSAALKEKLFKNMSQRAVQILKEEMQTKGPVRVSDVEKAQQNIINIARRLETEGKIILSGKGGEDFVA
jgi:flagellar motor switch protein FliG